MTFDNSQSYHSQREKFNNPTYGTDEKFLSNCTNVLDKREGYGSYSAQYKSLQQNNDKDEKVYTVDNSNAFLTVPQCNSSFNVPTGTQCIGGDIKQGPRNRAVNPQLNGGGMLAYSGVGVKTW
jgi:hypothetical protein